jgi:hypothetical protein
MLLQAIRARRISGFGVMEVAGQPKGNVFPAMHRLERDDLTENSPAGYRLQQSQLNYSFNIF